MWSESGPYETAWPCAVVAIMSLQPYTLRYAGSAQANLTSESSLTLLIQANGNDVCFDCYLLCSKTKCVAHIAGMMTRVI